MVGHVFGHIVGHVVGHIVGHIVGHVVDHVVIHTLHAHIQYPAFFIKMVKEANIYVMER